MRLRPLFVLIICAAAAAVFVRLGVWQLDRRSERRATNRVVAARLAMAPVAVESLPRDTTGLRFRRVRVRGRFDYDHELRVIGRTHEGSPGVHLYTPVRLHGTDTAVLVNRGWAYSPDGASQDLTRWREGDSASFSGFVELVGGRRGPAGARGNVQSGVATSAVTRLDSADLANRIPYPLLPFHVVRVDTSPPRRDRLATLAPPPLDEGPHLSYAIQWFAFAVIAIVGGIMLVRIGR